jgi:integrase
MDVATSADSTRGIRRRLEWSSIVKGNTFKRCGCRDPQTGAQLSRRCPDLRVPGGRWSRSHGSWFWQIELPPRADGTRRTLRKGPYPTQTDAEAVLCAVRTALAVPDPADTRLQVKVGDLIAALVKADEAIPGPDGIRKLLHLEMTPTDLPSVADYLQRWLAGRRNIKAGTRRSYESHVRLYLTPYLGDLRVDRLRAAHIEAMFDAISERNATLDARRTSTDPQVRATVFGLRKVGPSSQHRIRATLRKALNDAIRRSKILHHNEALLVELPSAKRPRAMVWTDERVATWRRTGSVPGPVMVWTPVQTGRFLDHAVGDRLYGLYHLVVFTGLRRGEACGVHWDDLDLDAKTLTVRWQVVQHGWATMLDTPKTDQSESVVALDDETVRVLRAHRTRQRRERLAAGTGWTTSQLVFTTETGGQLHPADVTDHFHDLAAEAGLPPIRLHDLRHGAATLGLAAGVDMKVISGQLRHSNPHFTAATYAHILPELAHSAAEATAAMVPRKHREAASR